MLDHFATLGLPRTPWIEPDSLKQRFLELSAQRHPDKSASEKAEAEAGFRTLNEAFTTLRTTRTRLLHLLELEGAGRPAHVENIPPAALEFFGPIAEITRRTDALLKEKAAAASPMLKVRFFEKALDALDAVQALQQRVQARISEVEAGLQQAAAPWGQAGQRPRLVAEFQKAAAALGFLERWNAQLQEKAAALTF